MLGNTYMTCRSSVCNGGCEDRPLTWAPGPVYFGMACQLRYERFRSILQTIYALQSSY